jgi:hypothetical protein
MSAAEIAARLTGKQAAAVRGIYRWDSYWEQEEGEAALYMMGIWNPHPKRSESILTPLGLEVCNHLTKGQTDD